MLEYRNVNRNPKGRKTGDCTTRALCGVLEFSYERVLELQFEFAKKTCFGITSLEVCDKILKKYGYEKMKQPRKPDGKKYKVGELDDLAFDEELFDGIFVSMANHVVCVKNNAIEDIWDCRRKAISNYWVKRW